MEDLCDDSAPPQFAHFDEVTRRQLVFQTLFYIIIFCFLHFDHIANVAVVVLEGIVNQHVAPASE